MIATYWNHGAEEMAILGLLDRFGKLISTCVSKYYWTYPYAVLSGYVLNEYTCLSLSVLYQFQPFVYYIVSTKRKLGLMWHVIMHRIRMSSSRHRAIFSWWHRVVSSWGHAAITTWRHVTVQARGYRWASWGGPWTVSPRWSRSIVDPNGIPYHCNMIALLILGQLSIIVLIHFVKDCFVIGLKFQQSS